MLLDSLEALHFVGPARKNINAKNLEDALKSLKTMLRESKKRRSQLEETVVELKKEVKKSAEKISSQMDSKLKVVDDVKREANAQIISLNKHVADLSDRLLDEKEAKNAISIELESMQKSHKKLIEQIKDLQREREALLSATRQRDRELATLRLSKQMPAGGRPGTVVQASNGGEVIDGGMPTTSGVPSSARSAAISNMLKTPPPAQLTHNGGSGAAKNVQVSAHLDATEEGVWLGSAQRSPHQPDVPKMYTSDGDEFVENTAKNGHDSHLMAEPTEASLQTCPVKMLAPSSLPIRSRRGVAADPTPKSVRIPQSHERSNTSTPTSELTGPAPKFNFSAGKLTSQPSPKTSTHSSGGARQQPIPASSVRFNAVSRTSLSSHRDINSGLVRNVDLPRRSTGASIAVDSVARNAKPTTASSHITSTPGTAVQTSNSVAAMRQTISQRSKEALLRHQVSIYIVFPSPHDLRLCTGTHEEPTSFR
jgi:hypothetical protein